MLQKLLRASILAFEFWILAALFLAAADDKFTQSCPQPHYPQPARQGLTIDAQCVIQGAGSEVDTNPAEGEQDRAKNNFCADQSAGAVTTSDLQKLQEKVQQNSSINFGEGKGPTTDRSPLRDLGPLSEGKVVVFTGFVLVARQEGAESVNCELGKPAKGQKPTAADALLHDIHISLVDSKQVTSECQGIVAEMSPHHRPAEWTQVNVEKAGKQHLPVRVTGQLFFDSSHNLPCVGGQPPAGQNSNPKRIALWEIHPIYQFEVCPTGTCGETGWKPLSDWVDGKYLYRAALQRIVDGNLGNFELRNRRVAHVADRFDADGAGVIGVHHHLACPIEKLDAGTELG
jgi:hypothetical protein